MNHEPISQLEDNADQLQHTRACETSALYEGKRCTCGIQDLRDAIMKYRRNVWLENREN